MRVAVFANLPPGGARRAAYELIRHTAGDYDYDFHRIDFPQAGDRLAAGQDIGSLVKEVFDYPFRPAAAGPDSVRRVLDIRAMASLQEDVARAIDERDYDLVFVHHDRLTHAPPVLRFLRTPSLYYLQEPRRQSFEYTMMHRRRPAAGVGPKAARLAASTFDLWMKEADIRASRAATHLVANSHHSAESIYRAYGRHPAVSYLGVDDEVFCLGEAEREGVLAVGALDPIKGHDLTIEAIGCLPAADRPPLTLVFDRERPGVRDRLVALAGERGVDLRLRGGIGDRELVELYQSSVATICAAAVEPFGLTTIESLACGTPVIAVNEGGYREVVRDGDNGLLVHRRPDRVAAGVAEVLRRPDRWSGAELRSSVLPFFSWEAAGDRIRPVLDEAAGHRG